MASILTLEGTFEDTRARIERGATADPATPACVSVDQWLAWREASVTTHRDIGVWLEPEDDIGALAARIEGLGLIAIEFPVFTDGRGYSMARLLRERIGYRGELRATGDILRDQLWFLHQVGFDAFQLRADQDLAAACEAFSDYTVPDGWTNGTRTI
ncbi:DUF934 domain-containing protein [Nitrogeniibacter aestuarii]|uniref:DUF934 domain-containing protein n=1 Tax=Nitrogeniibacter aestuarii TaxID=2815343 RepID=UPI001E507FDF|nr:DUF934 domain-containing protein [Nitrogeniibacter aestuarii]